MEETDKRWSKIREFPAHAGTVNSVCLTHRQDKISMIATGGSDKKVNLWSLDRPNCINSLVGHVTPVVCVRFSMTQDQICAGSQTGVLKIWDYVSSKNLRTLMGHRSSIRCTEYHPQGGLLISGSSNSIIKLWDIRKRDCISSYKGHNLAVNVIKFSPSGKWIVSGGDDNRVKIWDLRNGKVVQEFNDHRAPITSLAFQSTELYLASCSSDDTFKIYDLESSSVAATTTIEGHPMNFITSHPDAKSLFVASAEILGVYGWNPCSNHDSLRTNWPKMQDMSIIADELTCVSSKRENVSIASVDLRSVNRGWKDADKSDETFEANKTFTKMDSLSSESGDTGGEKPTVEILDKSTASQPFIIENRTISDEPSIPITDNTVSQSATAAENDVNFTLLSSLTESAAVTTHAQQDFKIKSSQSDLGLSTSPTLLVGNEQNGNALKNGLEIDALQENAVPPIPIFPNYINDASSPISSGPQPLDLSTIPSSSRQEKRPVTASEYFVSRRKKNVSLAGIPGFSNSKAGVVQSSSSTRINGMPKEVKKEATSTLPKATSDKSTPELKREGTFNLPKPIAVTSKPNLAGEKHSEQHSKTAILNSDSVKVHPGAQAHESIPDTEMFFQKISEAPRHTYADSNNSSALQNIQGEVLSGSKDYKMNDVIGAGQEDHDSNNLSPPVKDLMSLNHTNNNIKNNAIIYAISEQHKQVLAELEIRQRNLLALHKIWKTKDMKATAEAAINFNDITITVAILDIFSRRPSILNLDICVLFLPAVLQLLRSPCEEHIKCGANTLCIVLQNFKPVIMESISSPETLGVNLSREERRRKCMLCREHLTSIHEYVANRKRDKFGILFSDILVLLSGLN